MAETKIADFSVDDVGRVIVRNELGEVTGARGFVPSFYRQSPHAEDTLDAVIVNDGQPIAVHGDVLTLRKCPAEYRWAAGRLEAGQYRPGPVVDGKVELMDPRDFQELHGRAYLEYFRVRNQPAGDPNRRPIPTVRDYVAKKIDRISGKIIPLGSDIHLEAEAPKQLFSGKRDQWFEPTDPEAQPPLGVNDAILDELRKLRAENEEIRKQLATSDKKAPRSGGKMTPCGEVRTNVASHVRFCKKPACLKAKEALQQASAGAA